MEGEGVMATELKLVDGELGANYVWAATGPHSRCPYTFLYEENPVFGSDGFVGEYFCSDIPVEEVPPGHKRKYRLFPVGGPIDCRPSPAGERSDASDIESAMGRLIDEFGERQVYNTAIEMVTKYVNRQKEESKPPAWSDHDGPSRPVDEPQYPHEPGHIES